LNYQTLNAEQLRKMLLAGALSLSKHKQEVNNLNVFPVPDGDTGTNMNLTMAAANQELNKLVDPELKDVCEALATGSLMGARGNSGVILSQLFRGFAKSLGSEKQVTSVAFANALQEGVNTAYKAVIKPVEGTILTVAKSSARTAVKQARDFDNLADFLDAVLADARVTLAKTPELLAVLRQAGVVDAGGQGLCYIYEGWLAFLRGQDVKVPTASTAPVSVLASQPNIQEQDLEFTYCTEFIVTGDNLSEDSFRKELNDKGDSLLVVGTSGLIKIHMHTNNPGQVLEFALKMGKELQDIKIENMRLQHSVVIAQQPQADFIPPILTEPRFNGVIAVSAGEGLNEIFKSMGVSHIIAGGQTMNPSTEDFIKAIEEIQAEQIVILPNNSNIIMAARQAAELSQKPVAVIPTKTIPQGISALLNYSPDEENLEELAKSMEDAAKNVKSGQVTFAVRDSVFDGQPIQEGNILGIADGKITVVGQEVWDTVVNLIADMVDDSAEIITLFFGAEVDRNDAEVLVTELQEQYPDHEVEIYYGGQPLYYYLIAIE
jgi:DAK2 domain fusion protein YloV